MKNTIWDNPVLWSDKVAGSKPKVLVFTLLHASVLAAIFYVYWLLAPFCLEHPLLLVTPALILVVAAVIYPAIYLYAMHRLLMIVKDKKGPEDGAKTKALNGDQSGSP